MRRASDGVCAPARPTNRRVSPNGRLERTATEPTRPPATSTSIEMAPASGQFIARPPRRALRRPRRNARRSSAPGAAPGRDVRAANSARIALRAVRTALAMSANAPIGENSEQELSRPKPGQFADDQLDVAGGQRELDRRARAKGGRGRRVGEVGGDEIHEPRRHDDADRASGVDAKTLGGDGERRVADRQARHRVAAICR